MKGIIFFDFDGTISNRDSFLLFLRKASKSRFFLACCVLFPKILLYLCKIYPRQKLKEDFLCILFKGRKIEELRSQATSFCKSSLKTIIRPKALAAIRQYQKSGDTVVVVTASPRIFLEPWCKEIGIDILGTELAVNIDGEVTGKLEGKNCRGEEKVQRIKSHYCLSDYKEISAYGDTEGDYAMLELAAPEKRYFKPFT